MTTNPTITVELKLNGTWTDVSGWVDVGEGGAAVVITRGRENEQADTQPGACTFSLVNDDGRFSLDLTTGAYYPHFKRWIEVRVTIKGSRRFTGYVSNVETTLDDDTGLHAHSAITCTDTLGIQAMSPAARSWADELIGALNPIYWWPMNDAAGSLTAAAAAGGIPLVAARVAGSAAEPRELSDLVEFGVSSPASLETSTQATLKMEGDGTARQYAQMSVTIPSVATPFTVLATVGAEAPTSATVFSIGLLSLEWVNGTIELWFDATSVTLPSIANRTALIAVTVTSTQVSVLDVSTGVAQAVSLPVGWVMLPGNLVLGGPATSGYGDLTYSNVAIIPGALSTAAYLALRTQLLGNGVGVVSQWLGRALSVAGVTQPLSLTADRQMQRPTLKGSNPAEIGNTLAKSCGGVYLAARDGSPYWIDPSYCPARVEIPFEHIDPDVSREPDESLSYTDVTVDGVVIASSGGWPKGERELPGLLPDSSLTKYATWLANTADVWAQGRFSQLPIDLLPLDSATTDAYLALDVRSRILPTGVPPQFPADMVYTVEGSSETVTKDTWQITLNTAPDPRFVLGESLLGSDYRLGWE